MTVTTETLIRTILPASLYARFSASPLAKRLASGSLWSLAGSATSRVLVLVAMVLVARTLGQVSFGEFGLIQATLGVAGLMAGVGLGGTATRFVAQHAVADPSRAGRIIALVAIVSWGTAAGVSALLVAVSPWVARDVLAAPHLQDAVAWGAALLLASAVRGVQSGILAGLERFDVIAKLNALEGTVSLLGMVTLAKLIGVEGALLGLALGSAIAWGLGRIMLADALRERRITVSRMGCWHDRKILTGYALPSLMANVVGTPVLWISMTLLARSTHGYAGMGTWQAAYQWHGPIMFLPMVLMSVSIPVLVQEWEGGRQQRFRKVILGMCGITLAITLPAVIPLAFVSSWIMGLYGRGFEEGWLAFILLLAAAPLHALSKIGTAALLGMNRAWSLLGVNLVWGATLLGLAVWLVPIHGAEGLAAAFMAAYAVLAIASLLLPTVGPRAQPRECTQAARETS